MNGIIIDNKFYEIAIMKSDNRCKECALINSRLCLCSDECPADLICESEDDRYFKEGRTVDL